MPAQKLLDILEPAYRPCKHFKDVCSDACRWAPEKGLVPCGFGGATGSLDEVRLVIVTAEPGDPPDYEFYEGSPEDMARRSISIFQKAMADGGVERGGSSAAPFHRNLRYILNAFWADEHLETQLRKTWATNAVLCPAKTSGAAHLGDVERTCSDEYLKPQLDLLPDAFVLVLGLKARDRMRKAKLRIDAVGLHPSSRKSKIEKRKSWDDAARQFRGRDDT